MEAFIIITSFMFLGIIIFMLLGGIFAIFLNVLLFGLGVLFILLPVIVAIMRKHKNTLAISLIDIFFWWTGIGWLIALIWAFDWHISAQKYLDEFYGKKSSPSSGPKDENEEENSLNQ